VPSFCRAKLAAQVADVEVDASIEGGELPVKDILNQRVPGQDLSLEFRKTRKQRYETLSDFR
jgi:hypothetical protein